MKLESECPPILTKCQHTSFTNCSWSFGANQKKKKDGHRSYRKHQTGLSDFKFQKSI